MNPRTRKLLPLACLLAISGIASPAGAGEYPCPVGVGNPFNSLTAGQTAQQPSQPKCQSSSGGYEEKRCPEGVVTGTTYFVPMEGKEASWAYYTTFFDCFDKGSSLKHTVADGKISLVCKPAPAAGQAPLNPPGCCKPMPSPGAVNVEGSGLMRDGQVVEHTGEMHANQCEKVWGGPTVMAGGSKKCLIPFISVACDKKTYPFGTIFKIPSLKGVSFPMPPDGAQTMQHPGYVICEDTGSAITGSNRFDFFVGTYGDKDKLNPFTSGPAQAQMDVDNCNKPFTVIKTTDKCKLNDMLCLRSDKDWSMVLKKIIKAVGPGLPSTNYGTWFTAPSK